MAANNEQPDHALVGEPTNAMQLGQAIKIGRRGSLNGRLKVSGVQGHVAYPQLAKNPAKGLIAVLAKYYEAPLDFGTAYFSPSNFEVTSIDVGNVGHQRHPGTRRGPVQHPLQRPPFGRVASGPVVGPGGEDARQ